MMKSIAILSLLLLISLQLGLSDRMTYTYNGIVQLSWMGQNQYELQFCSVTCLADTNAIDQNCNNQGPKLNMCHTQGNNGHHNIDSILNNSCNKITTSSKSSNSAMSSPTITPTLSITVVSITTTVTAVVTYPANNMFHICHCGIL